MIDPVAHLQIVALLVGGFWDGVKDYLGIIAVGISVLSNVVAMLWYLSPGGEMLRALRRLNDPTYVSAAKAIIDSRISERDLAARMEITILQRALEVKIDSLEEQIHELRDNVQYLIRRSDGKSWSNRESS